MRVGQVRRELARALERIDGLRAFRHPPMRITPPTAVVGWPDPVSFDETFARGLDALVFPVLVVVGNLDAESSGDAVDAYLDGAGASSVKAAIDGGTYAACDSARVTEARVDPVTVAGIPYLAAVFDVAVYGNGGQ